jgi:RNA polymerase sigma-70 factor, ECF subfamily
MLNMSLERLPESRSYTPSYTQPNASRARLPSERCVSLGAWRATHQEGSLHLRASRLMTRYGAGDALAFSELYTLLRPRLTRVCRALVGPGEADDLLQEVFLKLHRARGSFDPSGNAVAWSYAVARTTCVDRLRSKGRAAEVLLDGERLARIASPAEPADSEHLGALLDGPLSFRSERLRETYRLVKVEGLTCAEAANVLGTTASAVKQRIHRANAELRAQLRKQSSPAPRAQRPRDKRQTDS